MDLLGFFFFWILCQSGAFLLGALTHYVHAHGSLPDKIIDGYRIRDHAMNAFMSGGYVCFADYDDYGYWEFYSLKNFMIHVAPMSLMVFLFALANLSNYHAAVASVCASVAKVGLKPLFCL